MEQLKLGKVTIEIEDITPEMAIAYLKQNKNNRKIDQRNAAFISDQIKRDEFRFTGDSVKFSKKGELLDGQHRLMGIATSEKSVKTLVVRGLDEDVFAFIDTGKVRSASDILFVNGIDDSSIASAVVRKIKVMERGTKDGKLSKKGLLLSNDDILRIAQKYGEQLSDIISFCKPIYKQFSHISHADLCMLYYFCSKNNQTKADIFFEKFGTGLNLTQDSAIYLLRDRLIRGSITKRKMPPVEKIALFITAWNAFITNKKIERLMYNEKNDYPKFV